MGVLQQWWCSSAPAVDASCDVDNVASVTVVGRQ